MEISPSYRRIGPWTTLTTADGGTVRQVHHPGNQNMLSEDAAVEVVVLDAVQPEAAALIVEREAYLTQRVSGDPDPQAPPPPTVIDFRSAIPGPVLDANLALARITGTHIHWGTPSRVESLVSAIPINDAEAEGHDCDCQDLQDEDNVEQSAGSPFLMLRCPYAAGERVYPTTTNPSIRLDGRVVAEVDGGGGSRAGNFDRDLERLKDGTTDDIPLSNTFSFPDNSDPSEDESGEVHVKPKNGTPETALSSRELTPPNTTPKREKVSSRAPKEIREVKTTGSLILPPGSQNYPNTRARARFLAGLERSPKYAKTEGFR